LVSDVEHEYRDERSVSVCSVCGCVADVNDIEDTNGWRWYSDGKGGLKPLCATCPPPLPAEDEATRDEP
jgi:transcription initiation factor TFIIIB Brf1 subunit/transcription initiation factor TFIIB